MAVRKILMALIVSAAASAGAQPVAALDSTALTTVVRQFLQRETIGLPGTVSYSVRAPDTRIALAACPAPEAFLPAGARLWGNSTVGVRCVGATAWTVYVPVTVHVTAGYVATARPLQQGQTVAVTDLMMLSGDLTQLPAGIVTSPQLAAGKTLAVSVAAGQPLRQDMLRTPLAVQQGQTVQLVTSGRGFRVTSEGRAVNNAAEGQLARVQTGSGQTVSGIARAGSLVEVSY
ncbi:MAG TPA: flagellar basal body P-ring formation chaperone FlgA [Burkholderiales bacterium]|nr:flagellar basal body P-ring formation chaperone FlgA [Burkholderiales bacterium]